ncbi:hypothetical protein MRX96_059257 [Rhipicephalus microplus]
MLSWSSRTPSHGIRKRSDTLYRSQELTLVPRIAETSSSWLGCQRSPRVLALHTNRVLRAGKRRSMRAQRLASLHV